MPSRIEGDHQFVGTVNFTNQLTMPAAAVTAANIKSDAGIETSKLQHRNFKHYAQESATTAADEARVLHVVYGATGTAISFKAGSVVANLTTAEVEIDLLKNGTTILDAPITLTNSHAAYQTVAATISSPNLVAGDVLEVAIDGTAGGGTLAKGVFAELIVDERAA